MPSATWLMPIAACDSFVVSFATAYSRRQLFSKRRHRSLARRLVAVSRRAVLVVAVGQRPHLWRAHGRGGSVEDAADHDAIDKQVKIAPPRGHCSVRQNVSPVRKTSIA